MTEIFKNVESFLEKALKLFAFVWIERTRFGVSCSHRTVTVEEEQSSEWQEWTTGGADRAHTRGGKTCLSVKVCFFTRLESSCLKWAVSWRFCKNKSKMILFLFFFCPCRCLSCVMTCPWKMSCCSFTPTLLRRVKESLTPPRRKTPSLLFSCHI